jgi:predicted phage tail protein
MRTVKLYGELAEFTGRKEIVADIADVGESIRMLVANFAGLDRHMAEKEYVVCVGNTSIGLDEINDPIGKSEILITPVIAGAGGNVGKVLIGAAMIGLAFATGGAGFGIGGAAKGVLGFEAAAGIGAFGWKAITYIGAALVFGGIAGMLAPVPKTPEQTEDPRESFNFSGITNTNAAGVPVPIVLGRTITGSVVVSAGIDTVQVDT